MTVIKGILGKKVGMTQVFKNGRVLPVTVVSAGPCYVMEIKKEQTHGYNALKIGYGEMKENSKHAKKPVLGQFKKAKLKPLRYLREIRIEDSAVLDKYTVGQEMKVDIFKTGEFVDVTAKSKGKGFQGGVKRWGWSIGPKSHGSRSHRAIGSIGASSSPSRVLKGLHMPGHMGSEFVTVQNLEVVDIDIEKNLILVKGGIPGAVNSLLVIKSAKKKTSDFILSEEVSQEADKEDVEQEEKQEKD